MAWGETSIIGFLIGLLFFIPKIFASYHPQMNPKKIIELSSGMDSFIPKKRHWERKKSPERVINQPRGVSVTLDPMKMSWDVSVS